MIKYLDFKKKYNLYRKEIISVLDKVFKRGWFILGPELERFENKFAKYLGVKYVIGVNSGTDAIFLALKSLGIGRGDEVITVANTAVATVSAIRMTGAIPVFVDINEKTFNINPDLIEAKISKRTKAILPVHLFGYPAEMERILYLAKKHNLKVVEDACQSHGAEYKNKKTGTIGDIGSFSFYPTKNLGAFGDTGAVVTNNKILALKIKAMRNYGEISKFYNKVEGINSRLDEIQAALLNWSLDKLDDWNKKREKIAELYLNNLEKLPVKLPLTSDKNVKRIWHIFNIRVKQRNRLRDFLLKNKVQTMIHYPRPIFEQPVYRYLGYTAKDLPFTKKLSRETLSLPMFPELTEKEVIRICKIISIFFKNNF